MERPSGQQNHLNEGCKVEHASVAMPDRYINHLFDSIKNDSEEICALCQLNKDVNQIKRLRSLFQNCVLELTALVQYLSINDDAGSSDKCNVDVCDANLRYATSDKSPPENVAEGSCNTNKKRAFLSKNSSSSSQNLPVDSNSTLGHNVDAPCFIPLKSSPDLDCNNVYSLNGDFDSSLQWMELFTDGVQLYNHNFWHIPTYLHSQYHLPHFHLTCASNSLPFASNSSLGNYSSLVVQNGLHGNGIPYHLPLSPYPHYPGLLHSQQFPDGEALDRYDSCRRHEARFHSHVRAKHFSSTSQRVKPQSSSSVAMEVKNERIHDQSSALKVVHFKVDSNVTKDLPSAEKPSESSVTSNGNSLECNVKPPIFDNRMMTGHFAESASEKPLTNSGEITDLNRPTITETGSTDDTCNIRENVLTPERLREFPELSNSLSQTGKNASRKTKGRLPRVKYQKKTKFSISDLYKTFVKPKMDVMTKNQACNTVRVPNGAITREKNLKQEVYYRPQCCCSSNIFAHHSPGVDKHLDDTSEEGDGWKKVKPRIRNRDGVKVRLTSRNDLFGIQSCQVCQSTLSRSCKAAHRTKSVNVGRKMHYTPPHYRPQNACDKNPIPNHVLDLNYKNVLIPRSIADHKRNIGSSASINGRKETSKPLENMELVSKITDSSCRNDGSPTGEDLSLSLENMDSTSQDPQSLFHYVISKSPNKKLKFADQLFSGNSSSIAEPNIPRALPSFSSISPMKNGVMADAQNFDCFVEILTEHAHQINMDSPTNDDNQNSLESPTIDDPQTSSDSPTYDDITLNEDHSLNYDNTESDVKPVVEEDAQEMHEEFMKYLNWSTWPTQMDEIDKFESMIACNNPSDPVLMYPSVSVEQFKEFIHRHPDEAQAFRREIMFKLRKIKETESKQQQAYEKRLQLLQCKTAKVRGFVQKVEDVKLAQNKLAMERKHQIDEKLRKAEENRKNYLSIIRRKAHDEEEKLKEIAFINELEAQNRRHDSLALRQEHEERLQGIIDERLRKVEEKAAKEAAVEERRRVLEAERKEKMRKIAEKRKKKEEIIDRKQQERENQRIVTAREKAREREERLLARHAAQLAIAEELQKRIQQKQEESARRHEENIELIRQRALEIGLHRNPEDSATSNIVSKCEEVVRVDSESSVDLHKEKLKSLKKKRCRKLRSRMSARATEYLKDFLNTGLPTCWYTDILKTIQRETSSCNASDLLRLVIILKDRLTKIIKNESNVFEKFSKSSGLVVLIEVLKLYTNNLWNSSSRQHSTLFASIVQIFHLSLTQGKNWEYCVLSNDIMILMDSLRFSIAQMKTNGKGWAEVSDLLIQSLTTTLHHVSQMNGSNQDAINKINSRMSDVVSYIINSGLVDKIITLFQDAVIDENYHHMSMLPNCVKFFTSLISPRYRCPELMNTLILSDCFGTIPLLYEGLQKTANSDKLPVYITPIIDLLLEFAELDVILFQDTLGADGMALQIRGIASNLMNYCKGKPLDKLLQSVILLVGYFAIRNVKNQTLLQSGQQPTVLQQLVTLPFIFFCDQSYTDYLFPTLFVCSYNNATNKAIVENELNFCYLEDYVNGERGKANKMIQLFYKMQDKL